MVVALTIELPPPSSTLSNIEKVRGAVHGIPFTDGDDSRPEAVQGDEVTTEPLGVSASKAARLKSQAALSAALEADAEAYVELAFEAADGDFDEAAERAAEVFDRRRAHPLTSSSQDHET